MPEPVPVVLGANLNAYEIGRACQHAWQARPLVLSTERHVYTERSRFIETRIVPGLDKPDVFLETLLTLGKTYRSGSLHPVLFAAEEPYLTLLIRHKEPIRRFFHIPYPDPGVYASFASESAFSAWCVSHGFACAAARVLEAGDVVDLPDEESWVLKPAERDGYAALQFESKRPFYEIRDAAELGTTAAKLRSHGYAGSLILQEAIPAAPGDDYVLGYFLDGSGHVFLLMFGQIWLKDPSPRFFGSPAVVFSPADNRPDEAAFRRLLQPLERALQTEHYAGFLTVSVRKHARSGVYALTGATALQPDSLFGLCLDPDALCRLILTGQQMADAPDPGADRLWLAVPLDTARAQIKDPALRQKLNALLKTTSSRPAYRKMDDLSLARRRYLRQQAFFLRRRYEIHY